MKFTRVRLRIAFARAATGPVGSKSPQTMIRTSSSRAVNYAKKAGMHLREVDGSKITTPGFAHARCVATGQQIQSAVNHCDLLRGLSPRSGPGIESEAAVVKTKRAASSISAGGISR